MAWLVLALLTLAAAAKATADAAAHGSPRLARWFPRGTGPNAWRNKYRGGEKANGPAFPLSTTLLVFATDLWHAANAVTWAAADAAFLLVAWPALRWWAVAAVGVRRVVFEPVYSYLRKP